ncbi:MAG: DUF1461 domain-containing protein [Roseburia sp.]
MRGKQNQGRLWAALLFFAVQIAGVLLMFDLLLLRLPFLEQEAARYQVHQQIGCSQEEVRQAVSAMMGYVNGQNQDLSLVRIVRDGRHVPFFSERDLEHLQEVRQLVLRLRLLLWILIPVVTLLWIFVWKRKQVSGKEMRAGYGISLGILFFLCAVAGILMALRPLNMVNGFHELFFRSDTWVLNPVTDYLVQLFPMGVFRDGLTVWILGVGAWQICQILVLGLAFKKKS